MTCIATLDQVANPNDFVVVGNILLQNMNGILVAFDNICPHRGNLLQVGVGNRPLVCTYHGWSFDEAGKARTKLAEACLNKHKVTVIGNFVFVGESDYTDMTEKLLHVSATIKNFLGENTITFQANLPLVIENTLEGYHVAFVHKETFYAQGMQSKALSEEYYKNGSAHTVASKRNEFYHLVAYPNLSIGIMGVTTYVGILRQVKDKTEFYYRLYGPDFVKKTALELTDKVLLEDKEVVERVQIATAMNPGFEPTLTMLEPRVKHYREWIKNV